MTIEVLVKLSTTANTSDGSDADGIYMVSIRYGGKNIAGAMMSPGAARIFEVSVEGVPGSSVFTLFGRATRLDAPDITASGSIAMAPWCYDSSGGGAGSP